MTADFCLRCSIARECNAESGELSLLPAIMAIACILQIWDSIKCDPLGNWSYLVSVDVFRKKKDSFCSAVLNDFLLKRAFRKHT